MKNCQQEKKQKNKNIFCKNFCNFLILTISIIVCFFFVKNIANADPVVGLNTSGLSSMAQNAIKTSDDAAKAAVDQGTEKNWMGKLKDWAIEEAWEQAKKSGDVAYKSALRFFLNTLAYDTATYLATGDKGQQPMFETDGWGAYLKNVADNTAGEFIESLGQNMSTLKFNLCTPNPAVMLKINLGLQKSYKPTAPQCSFSKLVNNWDAALKDKDFLSKFQDMFNPWSNDLGIALTLQTGMENEISKKVNEAAQDRTEGFGIKPVTDPISGKIKTPVTIVREFFYKPVQDSTSAEKVYTGSIVADSIDLFINTLIGKLVEEWLKKGIVTNFPNKSSGGLTNSDAQNESGGITEAGNRFKSLSEPNFKVRGDYDILGKLVSCPDPNKAGPTNCVIDEKFRQAIEKRLTVKQAMDQGYLNANGIFGFTSDGLEPNYNQGYPYRSMLILRKFRILPVGWEVAAQKIKDHQESPSGTKNLRDLVDCFDKGGWCGGLVDPNWVLKAPQNYCAKEGVGSEIISEEVYGEGANSYLVVNRSDTYCADEQSCVKEKSDGSCQLYGYCTEEKRAWDFNGKSCEPRDNTCQTFKLGENTYSYLQNTLDYSLCNASNAGCKKYSTSGNYDNDTKTVVWNETSNPTYFNKNAETCQAEDEGCHAFIRLTPEQGETYADIRNAGLNTAYNRFASTGLIYEKLLPDYLKSACYSYGSSGILDGTLKSDAPASCSKFVRECKAEEAGCELYTGAADNSEVPAKVYPNDYCPAECVGYDTYVQKETTFDLSRDAYFIPKTAKKCSAEAVGCSQFTNLDEVSKGGEGIEYYTYLRQCLKKTGNESNCAEFYSWEGSDESGYQLKVESLKASGAEPAVIEADASLCNEAIYNLSPSNPAYNVDCRQFYNREGGISYHLYRNTVSCSDDCHPYRKTLSFNETALACKGGVWNDTDKSCIYMAIPGQGAKCSAAQNGCREYTGNMGNDIRNIFTDDFSSGTTVNWTGVNGSTVAPSNEAINLDSNNKGNSLYISGGQFSASRSIGSSVTMGKSYVLSFIAKASAPTTLNLSLTNSSGAKASFAPVSLKIDWQIFQTNLAELDHMVTADEILLLAAGQNFYIDNITLTEIVDRYYLIKDSWRTPASCDSDSSGAPYALYMLGCGKYTNRDNKIHYLKSFTELCSESAVGCELMIDTKNSTATTTATFTNSGTTKTVSADSFTYVVYDKNKLCSSQDKGCSLLGQAYEYENNTLYSDVYVKNNPDKYNTILCGDDAVGCQAFTYDKGEKYFKDPGDQVCEWRRAVGAGESYGWYKKKVKRCGNSSDICLTDNDCISGIKCQLETGDIACTVSDTKTLGLGGVGSRVSQPMADTNGNWAGICSAVDSGCTEYIDPISKFNSNIIFNGNFDDLDGNSSTVDGWTSMTQSVALTPNTVYRLSGPLRLESCLGGTLHTINSNNNLSGAVSSISAPATFYYAGALQASCTVRATATQPVELKPVVVDYQLKQNMDYTGCNGIVNFDKGCVLFNERSQAGAILSPLIFSANSTVANTAPSTGSPKDSNTIIKVTPDRTCDKWLACRSYIKDEKGNNVCFDIGLCDAVNENGDCSNFIKSPKTNQSIDVLGPEKISNLSGYAKVGIIGGSLINDYYPLGAMAQVGNLVNLVNGGFEYYGYNLYPIGWNWSGQQDPANIGKSWDANMFSVINNPISAQTEGIGYAREGQSFLKIGSSYDATSEGVDVMANSTYIITAYVNTKNLKSGQAMIDIIGVDAANKQNIAQALGNDWQFQVGKFTTGAGVSRINIKLYSNAGGTAGSEGNFYFDDIKIRPALNSKNNWYTTQSCRLYSKTDSLSCDYYEDSGARQKGWYGYCLEYDRAPGNPNACLLWYPVDKVKGDGIEEGAGYQGKIPVYYCTEATNLIPVEHRETQHPVHACLRDSEGQTCENYTPPPPPGYIIVRETEGQNDCDRHLGWYDCNYKATGTCLYDCDTTRWREKGWYMTNGTLDVPLEQKDGIKYFDPFTNKLYDDIFAYCSKVVQTVTSIGDNKYWASRVYSGSDWKVQPFNYQYNTDGAPFGSIIAPSNNPYDWDGNTADGKQPLLVKNSSSGGVRASSPYKIQNSLVAGSFYGTCQNTGDLCFHINGIATTGTTTAYDLNKADCVTSAGTCNQVDFSGNAIDKLKLLFAKSYGAWSWNSTNSRYEVDNSVSWDLPTTICSSNPRANASDYCAILPVVSNIKINSSPTGVTLTKNGFVNLTFNSKADSNQLPLTMYAIDWGDGEKTTVTGVEMRDRPNPDVPHSMYHLYSYWDLKAKASQGELSNGSCGPTSCSVTPRVQIRDNWGWCSGDTATTSRCNSWQPFGGSIVVKEK